MVGGERESFSLLEIPAHKKRNPIPAFVADTVAGAETKKTTVPPTVRSAPSAVSTSVVQHQHHHKRSPSAQETVGGFDGGTGHTQLGDAPAAEQQPPTAPTSRSRLSGFTLPLFSSTPLNPGLFSQKRRTSSKKTRKQATTGGTPTPTDQQPPGVLALTPSLDKQSTSDAVSQPPPQPQTDQTTVSVDNADCISLPDKLSHQKITHKQHDRGQGRTPIGAEKAFVLEDLQRTQRGLLILLDDFNSGKMKAFENDSAMDTMKQVREKQETLAKLHFELYAAQDQLGVSTDRARLTAGENLKKLMAGLQQLNVAVQNLNADTRPVTPPK